MASVKKIGRPAVGWKATRGTINCASANTTSSLRLRLSAKSMCLRSASSLTSGPSNSANVKKRNYARSNALEARDFILTTLVLVSMPGLSET